MTGHSCVISPRFKGELSHVSGGKYGRMFPVLKEAESQRTGERLGDVGGRIVAEVLLGLLEGDPRSYRNVTPDWRPTLPGRRAGEFTMADLLAFAGAA